MWNPQQSVYEDIHNLLINSRNPSNEVQKAVFNKISEYLKLSDFSNYLLHIFNNDRIDEKSRQISGLTLKSVLESQYDSFSELSQEYFKQNVMVCFLDECEPIRKTVSNLLNTFLKKSDVSVWPEILDFLMNCLGNEKGTRMSIETLYIIIEDSGDYLEIYHSDYVQNLTLKILQFLKSLESDTVITQNSNNVVTSFKLLLVLFENCTKAIGGQTNDFSMILAKYDSASKPEIRCIVGKCWISLMKFDIQIFKVYYSYIFQFFLKCISNDHYKMNFIASDFLLMLLELKNEEMLQLSKQFFIENINYISIKCLSFLKLTPNDLILLDNGENVSKSEEKNDSSEEEGGSDSDLSESEGYNVHWTLRKCCSKILEKMSIMFKAETVKSLNQALEEGIQSENWQIKECSILALGAIGVGSYDVLKPNLNALIPYILTELVNPHKLVRAISCWTLSRFTKFILIDNLSENAEGLFKEYLKESLKRLTDKDIMVQDAGCTSLTIMINTKKEKVAPYLFEIFKIIANVLPLYKGNSLLNLYDLIALCIEEYGEYFTNESLIEDLVKCIIKRWYETPENSMHKILPIFDILLDLIKTSRGLLKNFINDFYSKSCKIIFNNIQQYLHHNKDKNMLDFDVICKCLELIAVILKTLPLQINNLFEESSLFDLLFQLMEVKDCNLNNYLFNLIGELNNFPGSDKTKRNIDLIINFLAGNIINTNYSDLSKKDTLESKSFICSYSKCCWAFGVLSLNFNLHLVKFIDIVVPHLIKLISFPQVSKTLARNVSICLGRLGVNNSEKMSAYLEKYIKPFCLSLRSLSDSNEKQEAFLGLCKTIYQYPNGIFSNFPFFCDAISYYETDNQELYSMFYKLLLGFKNSLQDRWGEYTKEFPIKLQQKMLLKFKM